MLDQGIMYLRRSSVQEILAHCISARDSLGSDISLNLRREVREGLGQPGEDVSDWACMAHVPQAVSISTRLFQPTTAGGRG
jgi:hypothetical protein